jgi:hypothetical protein
MVNDIFIIRFAICAKDPSEDDIHIAFQIIQTITDGILFDYKKKYFSSTSIKKYVSSTSTKKCLSSTSIKKT